MVPCIQVWVSNKVRVSHELRIKSRFRIRVRFLQPMVNLSRFAVFSFIGAKRLLTALHRFKCHESRSVIIYDGLMLFRVR